MDEVIVYTSRKRLNCELHPAQKYNLGESNFLHRTFYITTLGERRHSLLEISTLGVSNYSGYWINKNTCTCHNCNKMSAYLRLFILCVCVAVSVAVLPANVPNIIMAKSSPSTKSLKVKPSRPPRNKERYDNSVNDYLSEVIIKRMTLLRSPHSSGLPK